MEGLTTRELVENKTLSMEDFLGLTVLEEAGERKIVGMPKEFQDFTDMFAVDYNSIKGELEKQNGKEVTLEDYLLSLKSAGEFSHKMDKPVLEFISAVLDITAVKPLIECCTGYDMITGEDLSDFERGMKAVSGVVSLFTLGQGSLVMNGGKIAFGETVKMGAKILAIDAISTGVSYGTSEICQAMGCPESLTLVLSLLAGIGTSGGLRSKVFRSPYSSFGEMSDADGIRYNQYWDDVAKGLDTQTRVKLNQWDYRPNADLYNKYKKVFDNPRYYNQETGAINWPDNRGFEGNSITEVLQSGTRIDRYGYEGGTFVSPEGTSYTERALPPGTEQKPYKVYEVVQPIEVQSGKIKPWFDEKGGGIQYEFKRSIADLLDDGIIKEVK